MSDPSPKRAVIYARQQKARTVLTVRAVEDVCSGGLLVREVQDRLVAMEAACILIVCTGCGFRIVEQAEGRPLPKMSYVGLESVSMGSAKRHTAISRIASHKRSECNGAGCVRPYVTANDHPNLGADNSIFFCQFNATDPSGSKTLPDLNYLRFAELCKTISFATRSVASPPANLILHILGPCSCIEVVGTDAERIVAMMANVKSFRYLPLVESVGKSMHTPCNTVHHHDTVATRVVSPRPALPYPASIGPIDLRPKSRLPGVTEPHLRPPHVPTIIPS